MSASELIAALATIWGVGGAFAILLQARQMLDRGSSCDVSARFFAVYVGGYAIWFLYGISIQSAPVIVVHAIGLLFGALTLAVALALRGSLLDPATWNGCGSQSAAAGTKGRITAPGDSG